MTITSEVISYLQKNQDKILDITTIAYAIGYTHDQVVAAISNKRQQSANFKNRTERPARGTIRYKSDTLLALERQTAEKKVSASANMYEQIGMTKTGDLILQDEDGNLFRATELT